eukprot:FR737481.1.p1 GENE.FR737481.1~~FR737481.1.p1  ORF type:complete len:147 (-),score=78.36 FR737481.1:839-1240(-)
MREKKKKPRRTKGGGPYFRGVSWGPFVWGRLLGFQQVFFSRGFFPRIFWGKNRNIPPFGGGGRTPSPPNPNGRGANGFREGGKGKEAPQNGKTPFSPGRWADFRKEGGPARVSRRERGAVKGKAKLMGVRFTH